MKIADLNACHPDYDHAELDEYEALYEGGRRWRDRVAHWIPKNAQEPMDLWAERMQRAAYDNHAGPIVDLIVAWLFSKPPTVEGHAADWLKNVDRRGTSFPAWLRSVVTDALKFRRAFVWVDLPARAPDAPEPSNRADEEAMGAHLPHLVSLCAEDVRDWGEDEHGNLAWVLCRHYVETRATVEGGRKQSWRWTWIDAAMVRRWEWSPPESTGTQQDAIRRALASATSGLPATGGPHFPDGAEAAETLTVEHKFGRLPVARLDIPGGLHVMAKVRDPAVRLCQLSNDLDWTLHRGAHALLVLSTKDTSAAPTLGAGYYLQVGVEDRVFYAEPSGAVYDALAKRIDQCREDLYRVVQQMASGISGDSTQQASSAASKGLDWQSLQVMLAAYAEIVKTLIARVLAIAAHPLKIPEEGIVVGGLEGWQEDDLATILADYLNAAPMVKSATFRRLLAKETAKRLIPDGTDDATRDAIFAEIDAADYEDAPAWEAPPRSEDAADASGAAS